MIRVAAFQRAPIHDDDAATFAMLARDLAWVDVRGIDLAVFPECVLRGHAYDAPTIAARAMAAGDPPMLVLLAQLAGFRTMAVIRLLRTAGDRDP